MNDVLGLAECVKTLRLCLTEETLCCMEQDLYQSHNPQDIVQGIVSRILTDTRCDSIDSRI